ncbi:type II toxin-antitoxin system RelE/ParE family toxin [Pseudorhodoplanes sp.]|uniref:type II toxin-antitoxin system RelE/ParE family toxin n=1 Tax=Pseudorhodoplanes sp. TaxID=1934341 RepID=UPI003919290A
MKVRYTETAAGELEDILRYLSERNPRAATAVARRVKDVASLLAEYPLSGREVDESGVRMASLVRYPFLVFYTVTADEVVILNVRHAARQWPWEE